jgi:uncharacterized protein YbaP (TraB family)
VTRASLVLLVALAGCGGAAARAPAPPPAPVAEATPPAPAPPPIDEALIASTDPLAAPFHFVAEKDGRRLHVLGTVHLGIAPSRLPATVWSALEASPIFVMETDTHDADQIAALARKDGTTLDQELGPAHWAILEEALGRDLAHGIKGFKTSVAVVLLSVRSIPMTAPMDEALRARATEAGARIEFLEAPAFQDALLDRWLDVRALRTLLDDLPGNDEAQKKMLTAYARGDDAAMAAMSNDRTAWAASGRSDAEFDQMNREILLDRNADWIAPLEKLAGEGEVFCAVGAAHLFDEGGVLGLLEARGWKVTRVAP